MAKADVLNLRGQYPHIHLFLEFNLCFIRTASCKDHYLAALSVCVSIFSIFAGAYP